MKKILVPTDFSKLSNHAADFAVHLAKRFGAEVFIVHFMEIPASHLTLHLSGEARKSDYMEDPLYNIQIIRANKHKLNDLISKFSSEEVVVAGEQLGGGFLNGIQHFIESNGIDLVILGTTGEERLQEFFSGNHAEQLIEHLRIPVLTLRDAVKKDILDIVLGLDLADERYSKSSLAMVKSMTDKLNARLHILSVVNTGETDSLLSELNELARGAGLKNYMIDFIRTKNKMQGFLNYVNQVDAGMVITLSSARSGIHRFFQHSFSIELTKIAPVPVMTLNKNEE